MITIIMNIIMNDPSACNRGMVGDTVYIHEVPHLPMEKQTWRKNNECSVLRVENPKEKTL